MVRTQLYLDEDLHRRLRALARKQGRTISERVREALAHAYAGAVADRREASLNAMVGWWADRDDLAEADEYARRLRRGTRLARLLGTPPASS